MSSLLIVLVNMAFVSCAHRGLNLSDQIMGKAYSRAVNMQLKDKKVVGLIKEDDEVSVKNILFINSGLEEELRKSIEIGKSVYIVDSESRLVRKEHIKSSQDIRSYDPKLAILESHKKYHESSDSAFVIHSRVKKIKKEKLRSNSY